MKPNIFKITFNGTEYQFRIVPFYNSDKRWVFQIEDLPPTTKFTLQLEEDNEWRIISGDNSIETGIVEAIGLTIKKSYL